MSLDADRALLVLNPDAVGSHVHGVFMRRRQTVLFVLYVLMMSFVGVYTWHATTLAFARRLGALTEPISAAAGHRFRFTDLLGIQTVVWDEYMQDRAYYESFVRSVGCNSRFGIGRVRDPSSGMEYWFGVSLLQTALIMVGAFCVASQVPRLVRSFVSNRRINSPISSVGVRLGALLIPIGLPVLWYALYPRARLGQGVVEMHGTLAYAGPLLAASLGLLAVAFDLNVERVVRSAIRRCPRCGYPTARPHANLCSDCGFQPTIRNVARRQLWRMSRLGIAVVTLAVLAATVRIAFTSDRGFFSGEFLVRWLLLRPMSS